ncbi:TRAP-type C4-dicarboxylate transport system, small permease component [Dethiosulfatibacter aminovorans DSM 17477]|uniref:TRAP-type C4-dicarboxylate transport system, small permease component n=1 Tax=Dethiosulfatibacter aminovorans DSM 17477 TaxID=1121476 RepID=A0A1M6HV29_9FIRM|nr:TRAP transporter small permease [Dethiosulfatibacter aminovorans]SHJ26055.1 TRAP-type C4-dicarboxylate transport system, small permease component [Dethiosulfatibacter aminovorans DSM 17477]
MEILKKIDKIMCKIEEILVASSILGMAVILIGNVISRSFFNRSWEFAEELGQILIIIVTFIGMSYAVRKGKHIRMSAVFDAVPLKLRKIFAIVISFFTGGSMFFLFYLSINYLMDVNKSGRMTPVLKIPVVYVVLFVCAGFLLSSLHYVNIFINNIRKKEVYIGTEEPE